MLMLERADEVTSALLSVTERAMARPALVRKATAPVEAGAAGAGAARSVVKQPRRREDRSATCT
jgi:hypothetical protein